MKGVILAGGTGSRLWPCTKVTNKHLLAVYDRPMIYYPLQTLLQAGLCDILIITGPEYAGDFLRLLGSGKDFGCRFTYEMQDKAGGIAEALGLAEDFADNGPLTAILGDNYFEDNVSHVIQNFQTGAHIFLKEVDQPARFGVAELQGNQVINIEEKPQAPKSKHAVTGLYLYDNTVFDIIKTLKPSQRGELEITDVSNHYILQGSLQASSLNGYWSDMGTHESLFKTAGQIRSISLNKTVNEAKNDPVHSAK